MKKLMEKFGKNVAAIVLPFVLAELVKAVEEIARTDINQDGKIGFGG